MKGGFQMKYSRKRYRKGQKKEAIETLVNMLYLLNPSATFRKVDSNTIATNFSRSELGDIKIPPNAKLLDNKDTSYLYGFVCVLYDSKEVTITSDAYDNANCLLVA